MKTRLRNLSLVLLLTASTSGSVLYAYQSSPECARWIKEHTASIRQVVHRVHRLSKKRVAEILAWNAIHGAPNTKRETLSKYDLACGVEPVDLQPSEVTTFIPEAHVSIPVLEMMDPVVPSPQINTLDSADGYDMLHIDQDQTWSDIPSAIPTAPYYPWNPGYPGYPGQSINPGTIPEPSSLVLLGTGLVLLAMRFKYTQRKS